MSDKNLFEKVKHEWLFLRDLKVHPQVQREHLNQRWVNFLAENLDPDKYGELAVVRVAGKTFYYVFDGQHRMEAAKKVWGEDQRVPCAVHEDCALDRQAKIFLGQNARLGMGALDKWYQRIVAKEEKVISIKRVLENRRLTVGRAKQAGQIMAVGTLEKVVDRYGIETLDKVLGVLEEAWGREPEAYDALHLLGCAFLLHRFNGELDEHDLARKMAKSEGPVRLVGMARNYAEAAGISVQRAISEKLLQVYNKGRQVRRLDLRKAE